jgi:NAD(P)-dependent dehydrogenase (short-subunit alcohol dehydrogenase family)
MFWHEFCLPEFKGQRALITGGTQGIDKAIAEQLARQGAVLYLNTLETAKRRERRLANSSDPVMPRNCARPLGTAAAVEAMLGQIHQNGPLDLLACNRRVNCADLPMVVRRLGTPEVVRWWVIPGSRSI